MAKSNRIGPVSMSSLGPSKWQIRYQDPGTERDVRRVLSGLTESEARAVARHATGEVLSGKGFLPAKKKATPTISDALAETIKLSCQRAQTRRDSASHASLFVRWIEEKYPRATHWSDLRPSMVQEYVRDMEGRGLAPYTVRNHLRPVKQAWKHVQENYPDEVRPLPTIRLAVAPRVQADCLEASELDALLGWLKAHARDLYTMAVLQSLCGLRSMETASLRRQDVDLEKKVIHVRSNAHHVLKNPGSERTLPIPLEVNEALREWTEGCKVIRADGFLFPNAKGNLWVAGALNHRWKKALAQAAAETGIERLKQVQPHRLRSSFATMAGRLGLSDRLVKRFMGHSVNDVLGTHYEKVGLADLGEVSHRMAEWRSLIEREQNWQISGSYAKPISVTG